MTEPRLSYPLQTCACGLIPDSSGDKHRHRSHHRRWKEGTTITKAAYGAGIVANGFSVVRVIDPAPANNLVRTLARMFCYLMHYDFVQWPTYHAGRWDNAWATDQQIAVLFARNGVVLGHLLTCRRSSAICAVPGRDRYSLDEAIPSEFRGVAQIFVCADARRTGIATSLVEEAARHHGIAAHRLAWESPLSEGGYALAESFTSARGHDLFFS